MNALRIAMWSGPRNISTAMMRSWGNRPDTFVTDEPLYSHYLKTTGLPHPGAAETIASQDSDWRRVVDWLTGPIPHGRSIWYQKHMAHHLLPNIDEAWLDRVTNCFLIREPAQMITSLLEFIPEPTLSDTGLPQQVRLFERESRRLGKIPPVIDGRDVLMDPRGMLGALCDRLGVEFTGAMLHWPAGPRQTDGVWAKHWYAKVHKTTGFGAYRRQDQVVPGSLRPLLADCESLYQQLYEHRITV